MRVFAWTGQGQWCRSLRNRAQACRRFRSTATSYGVLVSVCKMLIMYSPHRVHYSRLVCFVRRSFQSILLTVIGGNAAQTARHQSSSHGINDMGGTWAVIRETRLSCQR